MAKNMREKAENRKVNKDMRPKAVAKYIHVSPSKANIVLRLIRTKSYNEAKAILIASQNAISETILKVLNSAAANAENNLSLNTDDLFVAKATADNGPLLKRMMPRAKGRADRILKKTAHITIVLDSKKEDK